MKPSKVFEITCWTVLAIIIIALDVHFFRSGFLNDSWNPAEHSGLYQFITGISLLAFGITILLLILAIRYAIDVIIPDTLKKADEEWEKMQNK